MRNYRDKNYIISDVLSVKESSLLLEHLKIHGDLVHC